jgi:hypothetical protein
VPVTAKTKLTEKGVPAVTVAPGAQVKRYSGSDAVLVAPSVAVALVGLTKGTVPWRGVHGAC